jgi:hypothetical protein
VVVFDGMIRQVGNAVKMIHASEVQGLPIAEQYFSLARGYLEGSKVLCEAMLRGSFTPRYTNSRVILHLCRHAVELFLKGAITIGQGGKPPKTHHLAKLVTEYEAAFSDPIFRFRVPFGIETIGTQDQDFSEFADRHHKTLDQRYRYPTDQSGKLFSEPEGFIPIMFMSELEDLSEAFLLVELQLKKTSRCPQEVQL